METSAIQTVIAAPFCVKDLPEPGPDEPLFLPADAQRLWYLGYLERWDNFQRQAVKHWDSQECKSAFDETEGCSADLDVPRPAKPDVGQDSHGSAKLEDCFRREVLGIVEHVYNLLLTTRTMKEAEDITAPERISVETAAYQTVTDEISRPMFVVCAKPAGDGSEETRLIGHVEYLGGKPGALTWAVREAAKNSWGSLRCVLGEIAQSMLKANVNYAFLVSSDEVMFLRYDIETRTEYVNLALPDQAPHFDDVDVNIEPRLCFSDPIKHADVLDEVEGTLSVKLGLLYMVHTVMTNDWQMPEEKGNCAKYAAKTKAGEKYMPSCP
ncbi:hypothetical protein BDW02DRAFT_652181 [Decorospora gaudefroyi]|uniref:Uncharacterized protein n=1 Tax=Decorospora gaudefroyi TaxID=184978 RepID=A0A6A5JWM0_9PLEO|nr:hypothetical protein BDW02DRAFT_652181 [Decorospora gaudefroyi]